MSGDRNEWSASQLLLGGSLEPNGQLQRHLLGVTEARSGRGAACNAL